MNLLLSILGEFTFVNIFLKNCSYSKQTKHKESDLDIAYFSGVTLSHYERFLLAGELAQIVNIDVDLVDLKEVDTVFATQIYSSGEVLTSIERRGTVYGE